MIIPRRAAHLGIFACIIGATSGCASRDAQTRIEPPPGCYRFNHPLGSSASGNAERGDSGWFTIALLPGGHVARPGLRWPAEREMYASGSKWIARGDSIDMVVGNRLVGWHLTLAARAGAYTGSARYSTDAIGGPPHVINVRAVRAPCPPPD